jgi:hypothetical protein
MDSWPCSPLTSLPLQSLLDDKEENIRVLQSQVEAFRLSMASAPPAAAPASAAATPGDDGADDVSLKISSAVGFCGDCRSVGMSHLCFFRTC